MTAKGISLALLGFLLSCLARIYADLLIIQKPKKMSNSLTQLIPGFNGTNYMTWGPAMKNYLLSQGQWRNAIIKPFPEKIYPQKEVTTKGPNGGEDVITLVDDLSQNHLNYDDIESWIENNDKARGSIMLWLHNVITERFYMEEHASSIWEALEKEYGKPGIVAIYQEFTGAMTTIIPNNSDPSFALEKIIVMIFAGFLPFSF